jgi:hypothetical protein
MRRKHLLATLTSSIYLAAKHLVEEQVIFGSGDFCRNFICATRIRESRYHDSFSQSCTLRRKCP